jgi:hypothetical protein
MRGLPYRAGLNREAAAPLKPTSPLPNSPQPTKHALALRLVGETLRDPTVLNLPRIQTADASAATVKDAGLLAGPHFVSAPCLARSCVLAFFHAVLEAWSRPGTAVATRRRNLRRSILDSEERVGTDDYCKQPDYHLHSTSHRDLLPPSPPAEKPLIASNRVRMNTLALGAQLPTLYGLREYVEAGGLMSYGPNTPDLFRRSAEIVDKILRGAKPGEIPVEQPTKFDLVINLTTAKTLGLEIPPTVLARADEVIE